jgi:hypothetical protein
MSGKIERNEWFIAILYAIVFQGGLLYFVGFNTTPYSPWDGVAGLARVESASSLLGFLSPNPILTGMKWLSMGTIILFYLVGPVLLFQATVKRIRNGSGRILLVIGMILTAVTIPYNILSIPLISQQMQFDEANMDSIPESMQLSIDMGNLAFDALELLTAGTPPADITLDMLSSDDSMHSGRYQLGLTDDGKLMIASTGEPERKMVLTPPTTMTWSKAIESD